MASTREKKMNEITEQNILSATELLEQIGDIIPISDWRGNKIVAAMKLATALAVARAEGPQLPDWIRPVLEARKKHIEKVDAYNEAHRARRRFDESLDEYYQPMNAAEKVYHTALRKFLEDGLALIDKVPS